MNKSPLYISEFEITLAELRALNLKNIIFGYSKNLWVSFVLKLAAFAYFPFALYLIYRFELFEPQTELYVGIIVGIFSFVCLIYFIRIFSILKLVQSKTHLGTFNISVNEDTFSSKNDYRDAELSWECFQWATLKHGYFQLKQTVGLITIFPDTFESSQESKELLDQINSRIQASRNR